MTSFPVKAALSASAVAFLLAGCGGGGGGSQSTPQPSAPAPSDPTPAPEPTPEPEPDPTPPASAAEGAVFANPGILPVVNAEDTTFDKAWEPSRVGSCLLGENVSPSHALTTQAMIDSHTDAVRLTEPGTIFMDETFTYYRRDGSGASRMRVSEFGQGFPMKDMGGDIDPYLYDDGTNGDLTAGDGVFTASCLEARFTLVEDWVRRDHTTFLNPALRGTVEVRDVMDGVRMNDAGFFLSIGDEYAVRTEAFWELSNPDRGTPYLYAWGIAGNVFDLFTIQTRDTSQPFAGANYARANDWVENIGLETGVKNNFHVMVDGAAHPELMGVNFAAHTFEGGMTHEIGHALLGIETRNFPSTEDGAWNFGDGVHIEGQNTTDGTLQGPMWYRGDGDLKEIVVRFPPETTKYSVDLEATSTEDVFRLAPVDDEDGRWSEIFLYMMGLLDAADSTEVYHALPTLNLPDECKAEGDTMVCDTDEVYAPDAIEFTVADFIAKHGERRSLRDEWDPTNIKMGILNISDRQHTEAEITLNTMFYRDWASSDKVKAGPRDYTWHYATSGLSTVTIDYTDVVFPPVE
ncbi:choice-of-anchor X domain-containing protein [Parvularcula maris]|uniref:Peptidase M6-like domain-containing protein n=1 Tax=Parvularcula maris TaxID=2965077 RepID=A0A9X2L6E5_9PROT|nr:choice-of-anchor X domain-containing protein [Parvularcula maris]MCQ8183891.1 hypothetical protein [Parvularcula maris]